MRPRYGRLRWGIASTRGQLQNAKERRRVQSVLAAHHVAINAADPLFETIDRLSEEVKKLDHALVALTAIATALKRQH